MTSPREKTATDMKPAASKVKKSLDFNSVSPATESKGSVDVDALPTGTGKRCFSSKINFLHQQQTMKYKQFNIIDEYAL